MEIIKPGMKFDFLGKSKIAFVFSFIVIAGSFYLWFSTGDEKYGIDYLGGHEVVVKVPGATSETIRQALSKAAIEDPLVQAFEPESDEDSVRMGGGDETLNMRGEVEEALKTKFDSVEVIKTDFVGPTIGQELRKQALIAIVVGLAGILVYISLRFEFAFALGAVAALFHDVIVCLGIYLLCGQTLSVATLAAALTIVGYSVNDTIIVFDRMREEILRQKEFDLVDLMNYSISATLSRTVITSLLTLFSALALLIFGGGAIKDLSLFLVVGVIIGTYSTIFIASPVALAWADFQSRREQPVEA